MTLDRTIAPPIRQIDHFSISTPERTIMPNGTPLNIIQVGSEDVVRLDLLIKKPSFFSVLLLLLSYPKKRPLSIQRKKGAKILQIKAKTAVL